MYRKGLLESRWLCILYQWECNWFADVDAENIIWGNLDIRHWIYESFFHCKIAFLFGFLSTPLLYIYVYVWMLFLSFPVSSLCMLEYGFVFLPLSSMFHIIRSWDTLWLCMAGGTNSTTVGKEWHILLRRSSPELKCSNWSWVFPICFSVWFSSSFSYSLIQLFECEADFEFFWKYCKVCRKDWKERINIGEIEETPIWRWK